VSRSLFEEIPEQRRAWYTVQVKPHKEMQVYRYLRASGHEIDVYYPSFPVDPVNPRSSRIRPYFPRYLFVEAILSDIGESLLRWLPGAVGVVRFGGEPAIVPENFIHELKRRVASIEKASGSQLGDIKAGDRVRVKSGPFADCEGAFYTWLSGDERVQIFLEWLGRQVTVTASAHDIDRIRS